MAKKLDIPEPKTDIRSWCAELLPNYPEAMQLKRLTGVVYKPGREGKGRAKLVKSVRQGSIVEVVDVFLLAQTIGRTDVRYRDLVAAMDEIEERGGTIRELSTGHETPRNRRVMRERARLMIIAHARRPEANGSISTGAPPTWPRSGPIYEGYETIWRSRRFDNDDERMTAIKKRYGKSPSRVWLRQQFGSPHSKQPDDKD